MAKAETPPLSSLAAAPVNVAGALGFTLVLALVVTFLLGVGTPDGE